MGRYLKYPVFLSFLLFFIFQCGCVNNDRDNLNDPAAGSYLESGMQVALASENLTTGCTCSMGNALADDTITREFIIYNTGEGPLLLNGSPRVELSGDDAALFQVTLQPSPSIASGDHTSFSISFTPDTSGIKSATVTIANDDQELQDYSFTVNGYCSIKAPISMVNNISSVNSMDVYDGSLYITYYMNDTVYFLQSTDGGDTWPDDPFAVSGSEIVNSRSAVDYNETTGEVYISFQDRSPYKRLNFRKRGSTGTWAVKEELYSTDDQMAELFGFDNFGSWNDITSYGSNVFVCYYVWNVDVGAGNGEQLGKLCLKRYSGGSWTTHTIEYPDDDDTDIGRFPSICCDSGAVYTSYNKFNDSVFLTSHLYFALSTDSGENWTNVELDYNMGQYTGSKSAIACDDSRVYIVYYNGDGALGFQTALKSESGSAGNWEDRGDIAGGVTSDVDTAMSVSSGAVYIAYSTDNAVIFLKSTDAGVSWSPAIIDDVAGIVPGDVSIAVDGENVYLCYNKNGNLWLAKSVDSGTNWN